MRKSIWIWLFAALMLAGLLTCPIRGQVAGPYILWWGLWVDGSDRYPGGTIYFTIFFLNAGTNTTSYVESIDTVVLTLPWETLLAPEPPVRLYPGDGFTTIFNVTIPENQQPGDISFTLSANWRYLDGYTWAAGETIVSVFWLTILPNPYALQNQVASLQSTILSLNQTVSSQRETIALLNASLVAAEQTISSQNETIASLQSNISALTQTVSSQSEMINSLNASLTAAEQTINSLEGQISTLTETVADQNQTINSQNTQISQLQGQVSSLQAELNTTRTETYVLIATTVIFLATTAYFAMRKPKLTQAEKQT